MAVTTNPTADGDERHPRRLSNRARQIERDEQRRGGEGDHRRRRQRVKDVLDRQRGRGRAERHPVAHVGRFRRLAGKQAERREIADGVTGDDGGKSGGKWQAVGRLEAEQPGSRAHRESQAGERDDDDESPTDLFQPLPDLRRADLADEPGEQRDAKDARNDANDIRARRRRSRRSGLGRHAVII